MAKARSNAMDWMFEAVLAASYIVAGFACGGIAAAKWRTGQMAHPAEAIVLVRAGAARP